MVGDQELKITAIQEFTQAEFDMMLNELRQKINAYFKNNPNASNSDYLFSVAKDEAHYRALVEGSMVEFIMNEEINNIHFFGD
jgi:hypothetical protein